MRSFTTGKKAVWVGLAIIVIVILAIILLTRFLNKRTLIVTSSSAGDSYSVAVYMVGDPEFPFGSTHCEAVLINNDKVITRKKIELRNDGKIADESNFRFEWQTDKLIITAIAEEMEDTRYTMVLN